MIFQFTPWYVVANIDQKAASPCINIPLQRHGVCHTATETRPSHCPATGSGSPLADFLISSRQTYLLLALLACFFLIQQPKQIHINLEETLHHH